MKALGGYDAESEFFKMSWDEFHHWRTGQEIIAIGEGRFRQEVYTTISLAHARGMARQIEMDKESKKKEEIMDFYTVRLKNVPSLYIGKKNPSYALKTDAEIQRRIQNGLSWNRWPRTIKEALQTDAHWFVNEKKAKVWTHKSRLKGFFTYCVLPEDRENASFNEFEVFCNGQIVVDLL